MSNSKELFKKDLKKTPPNWVIDIRTPEDAANKGYWDWAIQNQVPIVSIQVTPDKISKPDQE